MWEESSNGGKIACLYFPWEHPLTYIDLNFLLFALAVKVQPPGAGIHDVPMSSIFPEAKAETSMRH